MSAKILVTGGAGYLGSTLVPELLAAGYAVTVVDTFMYGENSLAAVCRNPNFNVVKGDARNMDVIKPLLKDVDYIIPLAALVGAPLCARDPIGATTTNRDAITSMIKITSKDQRILFPTTNSGYGTTEKGTFCTEETPQRPISLYGRDKVEAEKAIHDRGNSICFRLATVFGMSPRMRLDLLVNDFTYRAVNDRFIVLFEGHFKRNYIHVFDVARAFLHGITNFEKLKNNAYNVGLSDANLSKLELCEAIKKQVPDFVFMEAKVGEDPDKRDYIVSNEKIERTGYKPEVSLDNGIKELIKGFRMIKNSRYCNI